MTKEQEVIEYLKESVVIYKNTIPKISKAIETALNMLKEKDKEIEKYKYLYQKALDNTVKADKENMQLKKQIDLMAEYIDGDDTSLANYLFRKNGKCDKECIKQYFERKSEE